VDATRVRDSSVLVVCPVLALCATGAASACLLSGIGATTPSVLKATGLGSVVGLGAAADELNLPGSTDGVE
jgi:hypothetical protein